MAAALLVAIAIAGGWYMKRPAANDPAVEREREAQFSKAREDRNRNADWNKSMRDAKRMEEISRRRAEEQRERTQAK